MAAATARTATGPMFTVDGQPEGAMRADGRVMGSYLHGMFTEDAFRRAFLAGLGATPGNASYGAVVEETLDALADHLALHVDCASAFGIGEGLGCFLGVIALGKRGQGGFLPPSSLTLLTPRGYLCRKEAINVNGFFRRIAEAQGAVQAGTPMTARWEDALSSARSAAGFLPLFMLSFLLKYPPGVRGWKTPGPTCPRGLPVTKRPRQRRPRGLDAPEGGTPFRTPQNSPSPP